MKVYHAVKLCNNINVISDLKFFTLHILLRLWQRPVQLRSSMVRLSFHYFVEPSLNQLISVPLNSTVTLSSVNWLTPELQEDVVGDLSESNLDKTFNLGK